MSQRFPFFRFVICGVCVAHFATAAFAATPVPLPKQIPTAVPQQKITPSPQPRLAPRLPVPLPLSRTCGNKVPGFGLFAGYIEHISDGSTNDVKCKANQVCAEPIPGQAKCVSPGDPGFTQSCNDFVVTFVYSDPTKSSGSPKTPQVDTWSYQCNSLDAKNVKLDKCIDPPGQLAHCVASADVTTSCKNPSTLQYSWNGTVWIESCPKNYPYCSAGKCAPQATSCKDNDDPENDDVTNQPIAYDITLENGTKQSMTLPKTLAKGSAMTASSVSLGATSYPDKCKNQCAPYLVEEICASTLNPATKTTFLKPSTIDYDCRAFGPTFVCDKGACADLKDVVADCVKPGTFDCNAPFDIIKAIFPDGQVDGTPGKWHVSICPQPEATFQNLWVEHLLCFQIPGTPKPVVMPPDTVLCPDGGKCSKGLCSGKKTPFCTSNNSKGALNVLFPGLAQSGIGATVSDTEVSQCTGLKTIKYPVCDGAKITWDNGTCDVGYYCAKSAKAGEGAKCVPITDCAQGVGEITLNPKTDTQLIETDQCTGAQTAGTQGSTKIVQWECVKAAKSWDVKSEPKPCPAGQSCCVVDDKNANTKDAAACSTNCPLIPPPPDPIPMQFTCTDDDPSSLSQTPGTVTINGQGVIEPGKTSHQEKKDQCEGQNNIRQFDCGSDKAAGNAGALPPGLLKDLGSQSCTEALKKDGVALTPEQIGVCVVDPATKAAVCEPFTPTPTQPTPPEPPSLPCADNDPTNDIGVSGAVVISKPDLTFASIEDYCIGDYGVVQFECGVDDTGAAVWKEVLDMTDPTTPEQYTLCSNGCAGGKCCTEGSFKYADGLNICFEDFK